MSAIVSSLPWIRVVIAAGALTVTPLASAQLLDFLKNLAPPSAGAASQPFAGTKSGTGATPAMHSAAMAEEAPPVGASKAALAELRPDVNCDRPQEKFNVGEKLLAYGGAAASLRLERLVSTDFQYSNLTPQDKEMLQYLAQTTVWVPPEIESKLGSIFTTTGSWFGGGPKLSELDELALKAAEERLNKLKAATSDFPADIKLSVDTTLPDGAFAKFGGVIQISQSFLTSGLSNESAADFVLAHELSHIYKRHAVKDMQYKLISSSEGWELGRKVLQRAQRGMAVDPIADGIFVISTVPKLIEFVRSIQLKFGRNQELEADACSSGWLKTSGSDPLAAWTAYRTTLGNNTANENSYASTHPGTPERDARFRRKVAGKPDDKGKPATPKR
jgi:Peptidase family M48